MNILVCMKQVLDDSVEIGYDEATGKFTPDKVDPVENAFDTYALEMATRLKEKIGGEITLVSIGSDLAKNALKNGLVLKALSKRFHKFLHQKYQNTSIYAYFSVFSTALTLIFLAFNTSKTLQNKGF